MKLRRKLLSAGFALGATALTLTTSTFAWYTTNTEVTAKTITGKTSAEADTDSIYIAAASSYYTTTGEGHNRYDPIKFGNYGKEATPVYVGAGHTTESKTTIVLAPVSYVDSTTGTGVYLPLSGAATSTSTALDTPVYGSYDATNVMEFVLRFRTATAVGSATPIYFSKFDLVNTASSTTVTVADVTRTAFEYEQTALTYNETGVLTTTGIEKSGLYGVDFRKALKMTVKATDMTNATTVSTATTATKTSIYDFEKLGTLNPDYNIDATNKANALGYLNDVMGYDLSVPSTYPKSTGEGAIVKELQYDTKGSLDEDSALKAFEIPATGYLEVRFTIWLDGWDSYCYDVCRKQGFTLDMAFTTNVNEAVIK